MIVVSNNSGIGNRIKNLVSAMRRAYVKRDSIRVNFQYEHLFRIPLSWGTVNEEIEACSTWRLEIFKELDEVPSVYERKIFPIIHDSNNVFYMDDGIDCQYENITNFYKYEFLRFFCLFNFEESILSAANSIWDRISNLDPVGVHIRSWVDEPGRRSRLFDLNIYLEEMERFNDSKIFFVASDDPRVIDDLRVKFPKRVFSLAIPEGNRHTAISNNPTFEKAALVDLILLSRCTNMIGSYQSSYSECSWWFSGCRQSVVIPKALCVSQLEYSQKNKAKL